MLRNTRTESGLIRLRDLIGLIIFAAVCGEIYHLLAGLAAHIHPVQP